MRDACFALDTFTFVLWRGRWLVGHVLVVSFGVAFVALGLWQLDRHREKESERDAALVAYAEPAPALTEFESSPPSGTRVEVAGTYDTDGEVLIRNRVRDGEGGYEVLTPLRLDDGSAVVVGRGWLSRAQVESGRPDANPPGGRVVVRGTVGTSRTLQSDDRVDERGGRPALPRVDVDRIGERVPYEVLPVWVTAQWQEPADADGVPALPEPPDPSDVNHLSYAFQWFGLALVPLVGWPIVLLQVTRRRRL